jgi:hypothetical protein
MIEVIGVGIAWSVGGADLIGLQERKEKIQVEGG